MSKGNMLLGHARGKVGSLVFSRSNGQQIVRSRAEVVKNPQTTQQMIQRIILNTVAQAYSRMSIITDHSFEGVQQGQKSMSYFMKKNMDALRQKIATEVAAGGDLYNCVAYVGVGSNDFAPNDFVVAKGTLPEVPTTYDGVGTTRAGMPLPANTYKSILDTYGLQRGDQLTFIVTQGSTPANTKFYYVRVILDPMDANGQQADIESPFIVDGAINLPNQRNEGEFASIEFSTDKVIFGFSAQMLTSSAIIVSRKDESGNWKRSNASLLVNEAAAAGFFKSMQECLDELVEGAVQTTSSRYLNNAGQGRLANEGVKVYTFYRQYTEGSDPRPLRKEIQIVKLEVLDTILVGYDAAGTMYPVIIMESSNYNYAKAARSFDTVIAKAQLVDNWNGFPADVTTDEQKTAFLNNNYISPILVLNSLDTDELAAQTQAALDMGFTSALLWYGINTDTEW